MNRMKSAESDGTRHYPLCRSLQQYLPGWNTHTVESGKSIRTAHAWETQLSTCKGTKSFRGLCSIRSVAENLSCVLADGVKQMAIGNWQLANGSWQMANGHSIPATIRADLSGEGNQHSL